MADTTTPNLGLLIADLNDVFNFGAHVEANLTTIDSLMGLVKCTSSTRPSNTYGGQGIYETDTLRVAVNSGTKGAPVWTYLTSGVLAYTSGTRPTVNLVAGMLIYETDTDALVRYTGTAWKYATIVVCTSATRPTTAIAAGTAIYETDTHRYLVYSGSAWEQKAFANFVCTSGARPASPFQGLEIYETDTGMGAVYSGSNYLYGMQQLAPTQVLGTTTATVTFSSIPAVTRVLLVGRYRNSAAAVGDVLMQLDGASTSTYLWTKVETNGTVVGGTHAGALTSSSKIGVAAGDTGSYFGNCQIMIDGWSNATGFCTWTGTHANYDTAANDWAGTIGGMYTVVGPHNALKIFLSANSFAAGSQFTLYGAM